MPLSHSGRPSADPQTGSAGFGHAGPDEVLAPVIAGAYARGVAETLDLLGVAGVFLDRSGEVLFASKAAASLLQAPRLRLQMRHLVADHTGDNRLLAHFIADAVGEAREPAALRLPDAAVELRRLPRTAAAALPGQMVRAVLLLADDTDETRAGLLRSLM